MLHACGRVEFLLWSPCLLHLRAGRSGSITVFIELDFPHPKENGHHAWLGALRHDATSGLVCFKPCSPKRIEINIGSCKNGPLQEVNEKQVKTWISNQNIRVCFRTVCRKKLSNLSEKREASQEWIDQALKSCPLPLPDPNSPVNARVPSFTFNHNKKCNLPNLMSSCWRSLVNQRQRGKEKVFAWEQGTWREEGVILFSWRTVFSWMQSSWKTQVL